MSVIYCHDSGQMIDLDSNVEHLDSCEGCHTENCTEDECEICEELRDDN